MIFKHSVHSVFLEIGQKKYFERPIFVFFKHSKSITYSEMWIRNVDFINTYQFSMFENGCKSINKPHDLN